MTAAEVNHRALLPTSTSLDVFLLGAMELGDSTQLLDRLRNEVASRTDRHGAMLICEHPPSITIGREGSFADVLIDREELVSRRMDVRWGEPRRRHICPHDRSTRGVSRRAVGSVEPGHRGISVTT